VETHPAIRRRKLGAELRRLRRAAALSGPALADRLGWSQSKISRMETAERQASVPDVRAWLEATGADRGTTEALLAMAEEIGDDMAEHRTLHRGTLGPRQQRPGLPDPAARRIRQFQPYLVPEMLQTEEYARAHLLVAHLGEAATIPDELADLMDRIRMLREGGASDYHAIITEPALRWRGLHMTDQVLGHVWMSVHEATGLSNVTVQVIPTGRPMTALPQCSFSIYEPRARGGVVTATMETPVAEVRFTGSADLAAFEETWRRMESAALSPDETARWLSENGP
jgi:transcriptional regulator with XRE-family HTH domain